MEEISFDTIQQVNDYYGAETLHPLVSVVRIERSTAMTVSKYQIHYGVYAIWLKETKGCNLSYGRTPYDFDAQTVTSFEPGQTVTVETTNSTIRPRCVGLLFHPDFLRRTNLGRNMRRYDFFHTAAPKLYIFQTVKWMFSASCSR